MHDLIVWISSRHSMVECQIPGKMHSRISDLCPASLIHVISTPQICTSRLYTPSLCRMWVLAISAYCILVHWSYLRFVTTGLVGQQHERWVVGGMHVPTQFLVWTDMAGGRYLSYPSQTICIFPRPSISTPTTTHSRRN